MNPVATIRKLYEAHPVERWGYTSSLESFLNTLETTIPKNFTLEEMDACKDDFELSVVLAHLPAQVVVDNFGKKALFWTWNRFVFATRKEELAQEVWKYTGKNPVDLERARLVAWQILESSDSALVEKIHDFTDYVLHEGLQQFDMHDLVLHNMKDGIVPSKKRLGDYSIRAMETYETRARGFEKHFGDIQGNPRGKEYIVFLDGPIGVALTYKENPCAIMGLFPTEPKTLMINQLQGIRPRIRDGNDYKTCPTRGLTPLKWDSLLVKIATKLAQNSGFTKLGIQGGSNNRWTKPYGRKKEIHMPIDSAVRRYDQFAQAHGFSQESDNNWYQTL